MDKVSVVYIAGSGRSGSTILDRVLGTLDGVVSFNEIYRLLRDGAEENDLCACGTRFGDCPFWTEVMQRAFCDEFTVDRVRRLHKRFDHVRRLPRLALPRTRGDYGREIGDYRRWLRRLYLALAEVAGTRVIVDSSKVPSRPLLLAGIPELDVHVVHLVRDLRAVVYAWQKEKFNPASGSALPTFDTLRSVRFWYARQLASEALRFRLPYTRVLYEDFARAPRATVERLVREVRPLHGRKAPFLDAHRIELGPLHSIAGNPDRFTTGATHLRLDLAWHDRLAPRSRNLVTALGWPLLWRYGYLGEFAPARLASHASG
jgi:hypothetical protein